MIKFLQQLLKKLSCNHTWTTLTKEERNYEYKEVVKGTEFWFSPLVNIKKHTKTIYLLTCHCGAIKKLEL